MGLSNNLLNLTGDGVNLSVKNEGVESDELRIWTNTV